jgi:hypothetical protein
MLSCVDSHNGNFCTACFTGKYLIPIDPTFQKTVFERDQLTFFDTPGEAEPSLTDPPRRQV